jgi:hypothetical protein
MRLNIVLVVAERPLGFFSLAANEPHLPSTRHPPECDGNRSPSQSDANGYKR